MSVAVEPQAQIPLALNEQDKAKIHADIESKHQLAHKLGRQGKAAEAEALLRAILDTQQTTLALPSDDEGIITTKNNLAAQLHHRHETKEAEALYRGILEANTRVNGPDSEHNIVFLGNLANLLADTGRESEAFAVQKQAIDIVDKIWGPLNPHETGLITMGNFADRLDHKGDLGQAESVMREVVKGYEKLRDEGAESKEEDDHAFHASQAKTHLASILGKMGRSAEAIELLEKVVESGKGYKVGLCGLGVEYGRVGRLEEAESAIKAGLRQFLASGRHDDEMIKHQVEELRTVLRKQGKTKEAEEFRVESLIAE